MYIYVELQTNYVLQAFGAPFIVTKVNGRQETVFGSDRFPILAKLLGE